MRWYELAKKLGWSEGYLSKVLNGYCRPSAYMADKARPVVKRTAEWWNDASVAEIQKVLELARRKAA
jgi:transcriptional regulator with XRE-family HTH domain